MYPEKREEARALRRQGFSVREIATRLSAAKSTVSLWVRDVPITAEQRSVLDHNRRQRVSALQRTRMSVYSAVWRRRRLSYQQEGRELARAGNPLHRAGCMLYWAEGSKTLQSQLAFVNSDPDMMLFFLRFLRQCYRVRNEAVGIALNCYADHGLSPEQIENHWLKILRLPRTCLRKTRVNEPKEEGRRTHRKLIYGTCRLVVCDVRLVQNVFGAIQEYAEISRPEWLG